ncbi:hypothetical protein DL546_004473 [Coniochaeta pulveracea]|uniref:Major facilitator superfamily (MFS) profile domain-containing protein n=1 Tax=Coniochaeta pulveracea TaxID=177199 RepID=A0A420YGY9_9PEZI|nr:hypothetical protein DL546_004473 [Coniochaeta pulveracea]
MRPIPELDTPPPSHPLYTTSNPRTVGSRTNMVAEKTAVAPTVRELAQFDLNSPDIVELIHHAEQGDAADRLLTVKQALSKYKKAVFWAMFLSTSLIMEGYDMSMVSLYAFHLCPLLLSASSLLILCTPCPDLLLLWAVTVQESIWCDRPRHRREDYHRPVAVWSFELLSGRTARRAAPQRLLPGPSWRPTDYDAVHGLDDCCDLHPCFCSILAGVRLWRGHVWNFVGCLPGK